MTIKTIRSFHAFLRITWKFLRSRKPLGTKIFDQILKGLPNNCFMERARLRAVFTIQPQVIFHQCSKTSTPCSSKTRVAILQISKPIWGVRFKSRVTFQWEGTRQGSNIWTKILLLLMDNYYLLRELGACTDHANITWTHSWAPGQAS